MESNVLFISLAIVFLRIIDCDEVSLVVNVSVTVADNYGLALVASERLKKP